MFKCCHRKTGLSYWWVAVLVFLADLGTKGLAEHYLNPYTPYPLLPFLNLTLAYNTGAAFSFLNTGELWSNILFSGIATIASVILLGWLYKTPREECGLNLSISLILGGACGNLWDRIRAHHVVDFIELYAGTWHWPVFNLADSAVCLGAFLMMMYWMKKKECKA